MGKKWSRVRVDFSGKKFGLLTVIGEPRKKGKHTQWMCDCICGTKNWYYMSNLNQGLSTKCHGHKSKMDCYD